MILLRVVSRPADLNFHPTLLVAKTPTNALVIFTTKNTGPPPGYWKDVTPVHEHEEHEVEVGVPPAVQVDM